MYIKKDRILNFIKSISRIKLKKKKLIKDKNSPRKEYKQMRINNNHYKNLLIM